MGEIQPTGPRVRERPTSPGFGFYEANKGKTQRAIRDKRQGTTIAVQALNTRVGGRPMSIRKGNVGRVASNLKGLAGGHCESVARWPSG